MLGVVNPQNDADAGSMLPPNIKRLMTPENGYVLWGQFHVCPIAPDHLGRMRFVTIDGARNLFRPS